MKKLNQNGMTHLIAIGAVVVVVVIAVVGYMVYKNKKSDKQSQAPASSKTQEAAKTSEEDDKTAAKKAAKAHFELVYAKKSEEAYKVTCQQFKEQSPYDKFLSALEQGNFYKIDLTNVDYTDVKVANGQARLSGAVGPLSPNTTLQVDLLKNNGSWCVYGYRTV